MRPYGRMNPTQDAETPPDTVTSILLAANTAQAMDYPADAKMVRISARSSDGTTSTPAPCYMNFFSTLAAIPTSGTTAATNTSAGSTGVTVPIFSERVFQVPGATGFSVCAPTSCWMHLEWWKK
jgi:hypothetical protein